jgi:hypothetical protein
MRDNLLAPVGLVLLGLTLGAGLRMAEPVVNASAGECDDDYRAYLLEVRRIAGSGTPDSQQWWLTGLILLTTYLEFEVSDPTQMSINFGIAPEPAEK